MKKLLSLTVILAMVSGVHAAVLLSEDINGLTNWSPTFVADNTAETSLVADGGPDGSQCVQTVARFGTTPPQVDIAWTFNPITVKPTDFVRFKNATIVNHYFYDVNLKIDGAYKQIPMYTHQAKANTWVWSQKSFGVCYSGQLSAVQVHNNAATGDAVYRMDDLQVVSGNSYRLPNGDFSQNPASVAEQWNPYNYTYVTNFGNGDSTSMSAAGVAGGWFYHLGVESLEGEGYTLAVDVYREDDWDADDYINMGFIDTGAGHFTEYFYASDIAAGEWTTLYMTWSSFNSAQFKAAAGAFADGKNVWFDNFRVFTTADVVPEPATMVLLAAGGGLSLIRRKK